MDERIGVAKAAKLLGINRSDLNKRLLAAGVPTFEGTVDLEKVKCIVPSFNFENRAVDRAQYLRENTSKPFPGDSVIPHNELEAEVQRLRAELTIEASTCERYQKIIEDIAEKLGELQLSTDPERKETAFELCAWLRKEITQE